jgi:endonuclease/exonuclease/phosphatase (EEP) superfamily protein YafD
MPDPAPAPPTPAKSPPTDAPPRRTLLSRLWRATLTLAIVAAALATAFAFLWPDTHHWNLTGRAAHAADLATWCAFSIRTFDLHIAFALALLTILVAARRMWLVTLAAVVSASVLAGPTLHRATLLPAPPTIDPAAPTLSIASINTRGSDARSDAFRAFLESTNPDVIVIQEFDPALYDREHTWLRERWPFFAASPRDDAFGMAIYSRIAYAERPLLMPHWAIPAPRGTTSTPIRVPTVDPQIRATITVGGRDVVIQGFHPVPPVGPTLLAEQRTLHRAAAHWAANEPRPRILIGDFNATNRAQSSQWFRDAGLFESLDPRTRIPANTWPSGTPIPMLLGVRIDRALASSHFVVERVVTSPDMGSDHRAIAVTYRVTP